MDAEDYIEEILARLTNHRPPVQPYIVTNPIPLSEDVRCRLAIETDKKIRDMGASAEDDETPHIVPYSVSIVIRDAYGGVSEKIGRIRAKAILLGSMMNDGEDNAFMEFDADSQELTDMYEELMDGDGLLSQESIAEEAQGDILYIEEIFLEPKYRGYGIGLLALDTFRRSFPGFQMDKIILAPYMLTSEAQAQDLNQTQVDTVNAHLEKYWERLGFKVWSKPGANTIFMGIWTGWRLPLAREVVPHLF